MCTSFKVGLCITQQLVHRRHRPRGHDIASDPLILRPAVDDHGRQVQRIDHLLQETAALAQRVDQPDVSVGAALCQNRQDDARESRPRPKVRPRQRLGRRLHQLGAVPGMTVPEVRQAVRPTRFITALAPSSRMRNASRSESCAGVA